jgi:hypothetical protein
MPRGERNADAGADRGGKTVAQVKRGG